MNNKEKIPKVSVLMPCYNHEKYVARSIECILNQTYPNIELIVLDNGSTDNSYEIIKKYSGQITQILHIDENDITKCGSLLQEKATGDYIAFTTSDDCWALDKIEKQMNVLLNNSNVKACFTWAAKIDENYNVVQKAEETEFAAKNKTREQWLEKLIMGANCLSYPSALIERNCYFNIVVREKMYYQLNDKFRLINVLLEGDIYVIEETLTYMLWHPNGNNANMSAPTVGNNIRTINEAIDIAKTFVENMQDELFIRVFKKHFRKENATTHEQVLCERFFMLMKLAESVPDLEQEVISFYYRNNTYNENNIFLMRQALEEYYDYSYMEFQQYCMTHGSGMQNLKRKEVQDMKRTMEMQNVYMQAMYTCMTVELPQEVREKTYRSLVYQNLGVDTREMIDAVRKYIQQFLVLLEECLNHDSMAMLYEVFYGIKKAANIFEQIWTDFLSYDHGIEETEWSDMMLLLDREDVDVNALCDKFVPFLIKFQTILNMYHS